MTIHPATPTRPPRLSLAHLPTPIEPLPRLGKEGGPRLWVKRDDLTGGEGSGNKLRKLEYVLAAALDQHSDCVVTVGGPQSNHCRATAAACARLRLPCHLVLSGEPEAIEGNFFLDGLLGAHIHIAGEGQTLEAASRALCDSLRAAGRRPFLIPLGASTALGALGYADCFLEILEQERALGLRFDVICLAVGSGGSYAGLQHQNLVSKAKRRVQGYAVSQSADHFTRLVSEILGEMGEEGAGGIHIDDRHVGAGYGRATPEEIKAYLRVGAAQGLALDPCYTGKAFLGMLAAVERGDFAADQNVLFIHTGGLWGWTASQRAMAAEILSKEADQHGL